MRLFTGIEIEASLAHALAELTRELRRRAQDEAPRAKITWVSPERLHLTVRFIGEVDEGTAEALRMLLGAEMPMAPFDAMLANVGSFPARGTPRVIWAGVTAGFEELQLLERALSVRLEQAGIAPDARPYRPHLTLARIRDAAGLRSHSLLEGVADTAFGELRVDAITLFQSRLSPRGPVYVPLQRTRLQGG